MYAGAIFGMVTFGPLSDVVGRRVCLIACSTITLAGALLSMLAWDSNVLIVARIITGIGMGGEYPLASAHSAESSKDSNNGARNVALLYLFGSGGGPVLCDFVTYSLDLAGVPGWILWRVIFAVGSLLAFIGLILRFMTTKDSASFVKASTRLKGTRTNFIKFYARPLIGTALIWFLFDIVEYGLKQNDAEIFAKNDDGPYRNSVLTVAFTRLLVIPSLAFVPWLLKRWPSKRVQMVGFFGCAIVNFVLATGYFQLREMTILFDALYIVQLSCQSLPGVTTMAIPAEIFPSAVKGTGAAISAASGKLGATCGSFFFTWLKEQDMVRTIFLVVTFTSTVALGLTCLLIPNYNGNTLDAAQKLATEGKLSSACAVLFNGPLPTPLEKSSTSETETSDEESSQENENSNSSDSVE